jgi:hypothetical protein
MAEHRKHFKTGKATTTSHLIFQKHGLEHSKIELIEEFPCENIEQLRKREGEIQRERECVNRCIAGRAKTEYRQENAERIREHDRQRNRANAEKRNEDMRQYYQANAERIKERQQQYNKTHTEEKREYNQRYYKEHTEKIKEQTRQYRLRKNTIVSENP